MAGAETPATSAQPSLKVRTLGGFAVSCAGASLAADGWRRRKAGSLFKALLGAQGYALPRERLLDSLWPKSEPKAAARNLHAALHTLRRLLGDAASAVRLEADMVRIVAPP